MRSSVFSKGLRARTEKPIAKLGLVAAGIVVALAFSVATPAHAQSSTVLSPGIMSSSPTPAPSLGLTIGGWSQSAGIASGYVTGGDGKGTVSTSAGGGIKLSVESMLTGSNNPDCKIDCSDSLTKMSVVGEMVAGGQATNQGKGPGVVTSVLGTNQVMDASVFMKWEASPTPGPVPAPAP